MFEWMTELLIESMPLIIGLMLILYAFKMIKQVTNKGTEKDRDVKSMSDRIYKMLVTNAKSSDLKKKTDVYLRGDIDTPMHKIGTSVGGVLNFQEYVIIPIKKRWWDFRENARMLMVEGEAIADLHEGDLVIEGAGIHPVTEKFTWVVPSKEMVDKYGDENIQKKREGFMEKIFNQLGAFDLNDDIWSNTKTAIRGKRASARKEQVQMNIPDIREKKQLERESRQDQRRIERSEEKSNFERGNGL